MKMLTWKYISSKTGYDVSKSCLDKLSNQPHFLLTFLKLSVLVEQKHPIDVILYSLYGPFNLNITISISNSLETYLLNPVILQNFMVPMQS